jgi:hypothetical protein
MAMLTFLAANFFISLPFRYFGGEAVYNYVPPTLAYVGTVLLVPGMVFAAVLGARTYRAPRGVAGRVGAGVGALIGFSGLLSLVWISAALGFAERDQAFRSGTFTEVGGVAFYLFPPLTLAAAVLSRSRALLEGYGPVAAAEAGPRRGWARPAGGHRARALGP